MFEGLPEGPWELVVSNPPYVDPDDRALAPARGARLGARDRALRAGGHRRRGGGRRRVLAAGGALVLEVGDGQAQATAALLARLGYADVRTTRDLAGRDRVVEGRR